MNEQQVIEQMAAIYARCNTYQDQGQVETITDQGTTSERRERVVFRTAFVRPMYFRFEWKRFDAFTGKPQEGFEAVWCDGRQAYAANRFEEGGHECENLDHAIANATAVSAHLISSLLMPDVLSFRFMRDGNLSFMADEMLNNEVCAHLCAVSAEQRSDILISKQSLALRRVREERMFKSGHITIPPLPPGLSEAERSEMMAALTEADQDLHTISDTTITHLAFDAAIPQSIFQVPV